MYKLFDELLGLVGYVVAGILGFAVLAVGFTFYPIITAIILLGLLVIAPLAPMLEKLANYLEARTIEKSPTIKFAKEAKQSFKNGFNKAFK
ncbi:hypothetical protein [Gallibacterium anatis]|uniref:hypothetical protein n=1 Tax=Gallibacterium anatis TaxID=750 RepID=UPI00254A9FCC|nr:hypothetical protein [Gallibacterium anatis]WIM82580.1 hypothetical protein QP019_02660 [Gallibacterium anatis]